MSTALKLASALSLKKDYIRVALLDITHNLHAQKSYTRKKKCLPTLKKNW